MHALGVVPIPRGHRVEVRTFLRDRGRKQDPAFDEPLITDLDTGVVYGTDWHFRALSGYRPGTVQDLPTEPRADLQVHSVVTGTVSATRVSTVGGGEALFQQTTLVLDISG